MKKSPSSEPAQQRREADAKELPLRLRLPNPPPVFVGRDAELSWLQQALSRAPVALLSGPGGIGKTALALQALHSLPSIHPRRVLYVLLRPGHP